VTAGHYFYDEKVDSNVKTGLYLASFGTIIVVLEPMLIGNNGVNITERIL